MEKRSTPIGTGALIWRLRSKTFIASFALLLLAAAGLASPASAGKNAFVASICAADPGATACSFNTPCTVIPDTCEFETTFFSLPPDPPSSQRVLCTCLEASAGVFGIGVSSFISNPPTWTMRVPKISGEYPGDDTWAVTGEASFKLALNDTFEADCQWIDGQVQHCAPACTAATPGGVCPPEPIAGSVNDLSTMKPWTAGFTHQPATQTVAESIDVSFSSAPTSPETLRFRTRVPYPFVRNLNKPAFKFDIYAEKPQRVSPASSFVVHFTFKSSEDTSGKKTGTGAIKLASAFVNLDSSAQILQLVDGIGTCIPMNEWDLTSRLCTEPPDCDCSTLDPIASTSDGCIALQIEGFPRTHHCRQVGLGPTGCIPANDWDLTSDFCQNPPIWDCDCHGFCSSGASCEAVCGTNFTCCEEFIALQFPCRPLTTPVDALVQGTDVYMVYKRGPGPVDGDDQILCLNHLPEPYTGPDQCQTATLLDPVFGVDLAEFWSTPAVAPVSRTRKLVDWLLEETGWAR